MKDLCLLPSFIILKQELWLETLNLECRIHSTLEECPKVFDVINKHMDIAWNVNEDVLKVYEQIQDDPIFTFENKMDLDEIQLEGLERERDKVLEIAKSVDGRTFWEYMYLRLVEVDYTAQLFIYHTQRLNYLSLYSCTLTRKL